MCAMIMQGTIVGPKQKISQARDRDGQCDRVTPGTSEAWRGEDDGAEYMLAFRCDVPIIASAP